MQTYISSRSYFSSFRFLFGLVNYYFLASSFGALINFFFFLYFSHFSEPSEYVILGVFSSLLSVMPAVVGLHTRSYFIKEASKRAEFSIEDGQILMSIFFWMVVSVVAMLIVHTALSGVINYDEDLVFWVVLVSVFQWFQFTAISVFHSKRNGKFYFLMNVSCSVVAVLFSLVYGYVYTLTWQVRALSLCIGFGFSIVFFCVWLLKYFKFLKPNYFFLLESIRFSISLIPYSLSLTVVMFVDKYVVSKNFSDIVAASYLSQSHMILFYAIILDSMYKKITPIFLSSGDLSVFIRPVIYAFPLAGAFAFSSYYLFDLVFPSAMVFNFNLMLWMLFSSVSVFFIKLISLVYSYKNDNLFMSITVVVMNVIGVIFLFSIVSSNDIYVVPAIISTVNFIALVILMFKLWWPNYENIPHRFS